MCLAIESNDSHAAARALADLMKAEAGIDADPKLLRLFIRANWKRAAALAHAVHGVPSEIAPETSKQEDK
jgi:hypothetical protein